MQACVPGFSQQTRAVVDYIKRIPRPVEEATTCATSITVPSRARLQSFSRGILRWSGSKPGWPACFFRRDDDGQECRLQCLRMPGGFLRHLTSLSHNTH